jgi:RNA polymerase sigma-70 factor (ECF subfamily)
VEEEFLAALAEDVRPQFAGAELPRILAELRERACAAFPESALDERLFARELARRLGASGAAHLERVHAPHLHLAIACGAGDQLAIQLVDRDFLDEVDASARRMRARTDQADEVRAHVARILFVSEPGRPAALGAFSGRGDLRSFVRVIATRELVRVLQQGRREVAIADDSLLDKLSPVTDPELAYLRDRYRDEVNAAIRAALAGLSDKPRALLRYSVVDGWSVDRIGALYGIHRATAARHVAAARDELAAAIRAELAARLDVTLPEADSIVRLVQSRLDVSLERLLA